MDRLQPRVLIADPDPDSITPLAIILQAEGMKVELVEETDQVLALVREGPFDLVIADSDLPPAGGLELLRRLQAIDPDLVVILATGFGTVQDAVTAVREGAFDYISKPLLEEETRLAIQRALDRSQLSRECRSLREELQGRYGFDQFLVRDRAMRKVLTLAGAVADSKATVLLTGESGTGKTLLARAIHNRSSRRDGPFIEVSCGALPETLLESELFGHVKGAFTGAIRDKPGRIELAHGGTLFLDEVATASPALQVRLLRVIQDRLLERVGGDRTRAVDIRLLLATNVDLKEEVRAGRFREDLFYRIHVVTLEIPPLRQRPGDILHLASHFIQNFARDYQRRVDGIAPEAASLLLSWSWPGNVRELQNAMERAAVLCQGPLVGPGDLPDWIQEAPPAGEPSPLEPAAVTEPGPGPILPLREALKVAERKHILLALQAHGWNRTQTARALGIDRTTLFHKLRRHGLQPGSKVAPADHSD